jgi:hypothetical protein
MDRIRFSLLSLVLLLGFGVLAPECDCDKDARISSSQSHVGGALTPNR